jgi:hypothetical protein
MIRKQKINKIVLCILCTIIFCKLNRLQAQVQNDQDLYISDKSVLYIGSESFNFGTGSTTTSRTKLEYGVLSFSTDATWTGASDTHYVDGYVQTLSKKAFILPIGQSGFYAPIQVIPSSSDGVDAAYFRSAPNSIGSVLDKSVSSISSVEYWDIKSAGVPAEIALSWRVSSAISGLTASSLAHLTIVGWDGSAWVGIPSTVDENSILGEKSSLISGSISSNSVVDLSAYSAFSLGIIAQELVIPKFDKIELIAYVNSNRLFIESSLPITALTVYDITGKKIFSERLKGDFKHNQSFNYPKEIYIVKIELGNGVSLFTKKIINNN